MNKTEKVAGIIIVFALIGILVLKCIQLNVDESYLIILAAIAIPIAVLVIFRRK